jgi:hypothetical protein
MKHPGKLIWHKMLSLMETNYHPTLDVLPALGPVNVNTSYYQVTNWSAQMGSETRAHGHHNGGIDAHIP